MGSSRFQWVPVSYTIDSNEYKIALQFFIIESALMFVFLILTVNCLFEKLDSSNEYKAVSYIMSDINTVHFIQSEVKAKNRNGLKEMDDGELATRMSVYKGSMGDSNSLLYSDEKSSTQNTFFFTTPARDTYYIVLEPITDDESLRKKLLIDYKIFAGEKNRPGIVSNNDVEVSRAESLTKRVLEFVQKNISVQTMGEEDELVYKQLYEEIMWKVVYFIVIRFLATGCTMFYSNYKTKSFYASQGLASSQ